MQGLYSQLRCLKSNQLFSGQKDWLQQTQKNESHTVKSSPKSGDPFILANIGKSILLVF